jgi:hypothetical protein
MLQKRIDDQPTILRENVREAGDIFLQHLRRVGLKQMGQRKVCEECRIKTNGRRIV